MYYKSEGLQTVFFSSFVLIDIADLINFEKMKAIIKKFDPKRLSIIIGRNTALKSHL